MICSPVFGFEVKIFISAAAFGVVQDWIQHGQPLLFFPCPSCCFKIIATFALQLSQN
jgi:hypothetical protein